jgi:hypothetical protein
MRRICCAVLALMLVSLLLATGCGGKKGSAKDAPPLEKAPVASAPAQK